MGRFFRLIAVLLLFTATSVWAQPSPIPPGAGSSVKILDSGGVNLASVGASGAVKMDGSGVTQPVSGTVGITGTVPISGTVGVTGTVPISGTVGVTGTVTTSGTVTANAGTNLNTSALALETGGNLASVKTDVDNLSLAQASTTSGQKGSLPLTATTTAAPTYVTAQSNPLSTTTAGALRVDASATTQPVSGTVTANAGTNLNTSALALETGGNLAAVKTDTDNLNVAQGAATSGLKGALILTNTTSAAPGNSNATSNPLSTTTAGGLRVDLSTMAGANLVNGGTSGVFSVGGSVASGATDADKPVKIGGLAKTANPTAVTDGQRVNALYDKEGKAVVATAIRALKGTQKTTITSSAAETTIVTAVASTFLDLYGLIIANTSAVAATCNIKDATAGTTRATIQIPAGETRGFLVESGSGINQAVLNNNWTATCTSVASEEITALFVQNL